MFASHTGSRERFFSGAALIKWVENSHLKRQSICLSGIMAYHETGGKKVESYDTKNWDDTDLHCVVCRVSQIVEFKVTFFLFFFFNCCLSARNIYTCNICFGWAIRFFVMFACYFNHIVLQKCYFHILRRIWFCKQSEDKQHVVLWMQCSNWRSNLSTLWQMYWCVANTMCKSKMITFSLSTSTAKKMY